MRLNCRACSSPFPRRPRPQIFVFCPSATQVITNITFASYGNPTGMPGVCAEYGYGSCHAPATVQVFEDACLGNNGCGLTMTPTTFGGDPCPGLTNDYACVH